MFLKISTNLRPEQLTGEQDKANGRIKQGLLADSSPLISLSCQYWESPTLS
jgi:hypothetical protein